LINPFVSVLTYTFCRDMAHHLPILSWRFLASMLQFPLVRVLDIDLENGENLLLMRYANCQFLPSSSDLVKIVSSVKLTYSHVILSVAAWAPLVWRCFWSPTAGWTELWCMFNWHSFFVLSRVFRIYMYSLHVGIADYYVAS
jgi:hypothetical protein